MMGSVISVIFAIFAATTTGSLKVQRDINTKVLDILCDLCDYSALQEFKDSRMLFTKGIRYPC